LDFYQRPQSWFEVGANDLSLRKCLETKVDIFKTATASTQFIRLHAEAKQLNDRLEEVKEQRKRHAASQPPG